MSTIPPFEMRPSPEGEQDNYVILSEPGQVIKPLAPDPDDITVTADRLLVQEFNGLMNGFLVSFGLMAPEAGSEINVLNLIRDLLAELRVALGALQQKYQQVASDHALRSFETVLDGIDTMLEHAGEARLMAFASAITSAVVGVGTAGFLGNKIREAKAKAKDSNFLMVQSQYINALSGAFGSTTKVLDGMGAYATAEAQAATQEANAGAQIEASFKETMLQLGQTLDQLMLSMSTAYQAATQSDRAFKTRG